MLLNLKIHQMLGAISAQNRHSKMASPMHLWPIAQTKHIIMADPRRLHMSESLLNTIVFTINKII